MPEIVEPVIDPIPEPEEPILLDTRENVTGDYVIDGYEGNKNDWHYVNISWDDETEEFTWSNRAGVEWTLRETDFPNMLEVGEDCPYYGSGHTTASLVFNEDGSVKSIAGPWNEIYLKSDDKPLVEPEIDPVIEPVEPVIEPVPEIDGGWDVKEPLYYVEPFANDNVIGDYVIDGYEGNKNDWHYVHISILDDGYLWENRAGVTWTLTQDPEVNASLQVGKECPYYESGHHSASMIFDENHEVIAINGPWGERYNRAEPESESESESESENRSNGRRELI